MGFSSAYNIPKTVTKQFSDGSKVLAINPEFKKYQVVRFATLLGAQPTLSNQKIMLSWGGSNTKGIIIDGGKYSNTTYINDVFKCKEIYNSFLNSNGFVGSNKMPAYEYDLELRNQIDAQLDEYSEGDDPILYVSRLLTSMDNHCSNKGISKMFKTFINKSKNQTQEMLESTDWGNDISKALEYFYKSNDYILNLDETSARQSY